jgi:hypothetical protein
MHCLHVAGCGGVTWKEVGGWVGGLLGGWGEAPLLCH